MRAGVAACNNEGELGKVTCISGLDGRTCLVDSIPDGARRPSPEWTREVLLEGVHDPVMDSHVRYEVAAGVATITLDHQPTRNALSAELVNSLGDSLVKALEHADVRVIVLTNDGPAFCAGADLKGTSRADPRYDLPALLTLILDAPKPVIGRIAGHCTGGGGRVGGGI